MLLLMMHDLGISSWGGSWVSIGGGRGEVRSVLEGGGGKLGQCWREGG